MALMTKDQVKAVLDRVLTWPLEAQEEAVASLVTIEEEFMGSHELSSDDREALLRSAEDVRQGRFATDDRSRRLSIATGAHEVTLNRNRARRDRRDLLLRDVVRCLHDKRSGERDFESSADLAAR